MPEIKQEVKTFLINYLCEDCGKGKMIYTGQNEKAKVDLSTVYFIHQCSNCRRIQKIKNKSYPAVQYDKINDDQN